jgi:hypothetical protein
MGHNLRPHNTNLPRLHCKCHHLALRFAAQHGGSPTALYRTKIPGTRRRIDQPNPGVRSRKRPHQI